MHTNSTTNVNVTLICIEVHAFLKSDEATFELMLLGIKLFTFLLNIKAALHLLQRQPSQNAL